MKMMNKCLYSSRYALYVLVFMVGVVTIIGSNGDGDDGGSGGDGGPNALFSGKYRILTGEYEGGSFGGDWFDGTANGQGEFTIDGETMTIAYDVTEDRAINITVPSDPTIERSDGVISSDGNLVLLTDAHLIDPNNQNDVQTLLVVKKSTDNDMTLARMSGDYEVIEVGRTATEFYTSRSTVSLQNNGEGTWAIQAHSGGLSGNGNLLVSLSADGTFTLNNGSRTEVGIISPDASMFATTDDIDGGFGFFTVGVRKSTESPLLSGSYEIHFLGYEYPNGPQFAGRWTAVKDEIMSEFDATCIFDSRGIAPGTTVTIPHTSVAADGTFVVQNTDFSILSSNGGFFATVETETAIDTEIKIGLALK